MVLLLSLYGALVLRFLHHLHYIDIAPQSTPTKNYLHLFPPQIKVGHVMLLQHDLWSVADVFNLDLHGGSGGGYQRCEDGSMIF